MNYLKGLARDYDTYMGIVALIVIFLIPAGLIKFVAMATAIYLIAKPNKIKVLSRYAGGRKPKK